MKSVVFVCCLLATALALPDLSRQRRATAQQCQTSPQTSDTDVLDDGDTISMSCNIDSTVVSCIWRHVEPMNDGQASSSANPDILCSGGPENNGRSCDKETRITFQTATNKCGIQISNTEPEDTGKWRLTAVTLGTSGTTQQAEKEFEIYTYNMSTVNTLDEDLNQVDSIDTTYNYNTKEDEWEPGKGNYESVQLTCAALGGRPRPIFKWYIDNHDNDNLEKDNHFRISEGITNSEDRGGYIVNSQSDIDFGVDNTLFDKLNGYGIDTNPRSGLISFELTCEVQQGDRAFTYKEAVRINIERTYDDGNLTGSTIGIIVGAVVAVILLVVAVALLVFAKSSNRWCFAEDDTRYKDPRDASSHPRSQASRAPANQQQQQQPQRQYR